MEEYSCEGTIRSDNKGQFQSRASPQLADEIHTCDFCGADIFQNYFQCLGEKQGEEDFIVCPGCYVEGRTCACQKMEERERQSFDVLLNARWDAIQALTGVGYSLKSFEGTLSLQEQRWYAVDRSYPNIALIIWDSFFAEPSERSVFHAAFLLSKIRAAEVCVDQSLCFMICSWKFASANLQSNVG